MKNKEIVERADKYWICTKCAAAKKWYIPEKVCLTVVEGLCGHCNSNVEQTLIPVVDFAGKDKTPIWD